MRPERASQTALKVALSLVTLSIKDDWAERLPGDLVPMTERLLVASGERGYGRRVVRWSKRPWALKWYERFDRLMPGQFEALGHRKIFVQNQVEAAIKAGARQVLVVGAGFDTLCLRLAPLFPELTFFEVDHPATYGAKRKGVLLEGQPTNMVQIAADLGERPLSEVMKGNSRWDQGRQSVIVAEGLLQYLSDDAVRGLFKEVANITGPASRFVFTHAIPGYRKIVDLLMRMIAEPWLSAVASEELPTYIQGTGWRVISGVDRNRAHGVERYAVAERVL